MALKIQILWRPELNRLLEQNGLPMYRQKSEQFVRNILSESIDADILNRQISEQLFERDYNTIEEEIETFRKESAASRRAKKGPRRRHR